MALKWRNNLVSIYFGVSVIFIQALWSLSIRLIAFTSHHCLSTWDQVDELPHEIDVKESCNNPMGPFKAIHQSLIMYLAVY